MIEIKMINAAHSADANLPNEPFFDFWKDDSGIQGWAMEQQGSRVSAGGTARNVLSG